MLIWIETELSSQRRSQYDICANEWLNFRVFKNVTPELWVKMSEEYYNSTIEYNFTPFNLSKNRIWTVKEYLKWQIEKYSLSLNSPQPSFVWTHIHIFEEKLLNLNKPKLLWCILSYILENLDDLEEKSKMRLLTWHQLWTYWSNKNEHIWKKEMVRYWLDTFYYEHNSDKRKYSPIITSPKSRTGKPKSIEIRIIPNEFVFNGKLYKLLREIKTGEIYNREKVEVSDFLWKICDSLWLKEIAIEDITRDISKEELHSQLEVLGSNRTEVIRWVSFWDLDMSNIEETIENMWFYRDIFVRNLIRILEYKESIWIITSMEFQVLKELSNEECPF
jgi:hypothetical protein